MTLSDSRRLAQAYGEGDLEAAGPLFDALADEGVGNFNEWLARLEHHETIRFYFYKRRVPFSVDFSIYMNQDNDSIFMGWVNALVTRRAEAKGGLLSLRIVKFEILSTNILWDQDSDRFQGTSAFEVEVLYKITHALTGEKGISFGIESDYDGVENHGRTTVRGETVAKREAARDYLAPWKWTEKTGWELAKYRYGRPNGD